MKLKKEVLGVVSVNPKEFTKNRGHEYGEGRPAKVHTKPKYRREKQKLRNVLRDF
jgi:hypothetical protein